MSRLAVKPSIRDVEIRQIVPSGVSATRLRDWTIGWRRQLSLPSGRLSVVVTSPARMRKLNYAWRGLDRPTDVLAFGWPDQPPDHGERTIGEIFLCPAVIRKRAPDFERSYREHFRRLLQHGLMHVAGFDHHTQREFKRWTKIERRLTFRSL